MKARAVVYEAPHTFAMKEFPMPVVGDGDMVVEVLLGGVDGSEVHMFRGETSWANESAPVIFGDEVIARVTMIGDGARRSRALDIGDVVAVEARWPCSGCRTCDAGQYYICESRKIREGYAATSSATPPHLWGSYATHMFVPAAAIIYPVPTELHLNAALVACSTLANGVRWVDKAEVGAGTNVLVIGPGAQGLACIVAAAAKHAKVTAVGLAADAARLEVAERFGASATVAIDPADSPDRTLQKVREAAGPCDVVFEVAGAPSEKQLAFNIVRPLGTVVNVAIPTPQVQAADWMSFIRREVLIMNLLSHPHSVPAGFQLALELAGQGRDVGEWVTHVFPLDDAERAVRTAGYEFDERPIKVALDPSL